ncbi:MAG: hypothetical protein JSS61_05220 [Verrucomicrobia bacterium]|nr:hypothetical protein [Verrucomicrobiota bacterium]
MTTPQKVDERQQQVVSRAAPSDTAPEPFLQWKFKRNEDTGEYEFDSIGLSDGSKVNLDNFQRALKISVGTTDGAVGEKILNKISRGMTGERADLRLNEVSALISALRPQDETEAMLLGQFLALQDSGMKCLRRANLPEQGFYHEERLFLLANKLLNTANQTIQAVLKYRSRGQQTVQVVHVHNEGQAIVAQNLSHSTGEGVKRKSEN